MNIRPITLVAATIFALSVLAPTTAITQSPPKKISFKTQIAPILKKNCYSCHSTKNPTEGLDLSTVAGIKKGGEHKPLYVAKKPKDSRLIKHLNAEKGFDQMPPFEKLKPAEIKLITQWITEGAVFDAK